MSQTPNQKNIVNAPITAGGNVHIGDYLVTYHNYFAAQEVKIPHRLTNNIPTNADHILGRVTELAQAKDHLAQHQATVLFNGIGGIGKTALASKYMALYGSEYKHLAWITVQSTLAEAFTNNAPLLASLQITQQVQDYIAAKQLDKAFAYLFHQLNLLERTLVVIDNANDLDDLDQYKNWFDTANCHFLITSRSQPSEWATVEVDSLPEDEAVRLFRRLHPSVSADDEAIKSLLSKLFYHTLLIELVAKAGASTGIPFADLQSMIETQFIHHQSLNEAPIPTGKHGSVVATNLKKAKIEDYIWLIFSQVKGLDKESKQLLKAMALLPVATPFDLDFLKEHFAFFNISNAVVYLDTLIERGWLQKEQAEGQKPYFKMHPLIGDVVVEHLGVDVEFAEGYIKKNSKLIHYDNVNPNDDLFAKRRIEPYSKRLVDLFFIVNNEIIAELLGMISRYYRNFGNFKDAILYANRALQIIESLPDNNKLNVSNYLNNLALAYRYAGFYNEAALILERNLLEDIKNFGDFHLDVAVSQSNLALVYWNLERYSEAANLLDKTLKIEEKNFPQDHPTISITQSNLGLVLLELGRNSDAVMLLEKALVNDKKNFGLEHPNTARTKNNLALAYQDLKRYNEAANLLEEALVNDEKNFGKEHPLVATKQYNLATVYQDLKREDEAQLLFEKCYFMRIKIFGEDHHQTLKVKKKLHY